MENVVNTFETALSAYTTYRELFDEYPEFRGELLQSFPDQFADNRFLTFVRRVEDILMDDETTDSARVIRTMIQQGAPVIMNLINDIEWMRYAIENAGNVEDAMLEIEERAEDAPNPFVLQELDPNVPLGGEPFPDQRDGDENVPP